MAIKARIGDIELELESEADLRMLLSAARNARVLVQPSSPSETLTDKLKRFYNLARRPNQRGILRALADAADGLMDIELRTHLSLKDNRELAGVMSGLSKNASAAGLRLEHVLVKRTLVTPSSTSRYRYQLTPEMREIIIGKQA